MKRFATVAALTLLLLAPATPAPGQAILLVSGGLNRTSATFSNSLNEVVEPIMRASIGLAARTSTSEGWSFELGASYSQKGYGVTSVDGSVELDYVELTTLVSRRSRAGDRVYVHLLAGLAPAFLMSCQVIEAGAGKDCGDDDDDGPRDVDLGLAGGIRFEIGLSEKVALSVGALYNHGLLNLNDSGDDDDDGEGDITIKNRGMTLRVGLAFPMG